MNKCDYVNEVCKILNEEGYETTVQENYRNNGSRIGILVKTDGFVQPVFSVYGDEDLTPSEYCDHYILPNLSDRSSVLDKDRLEDLMSNKEEFLSRSYYILVNSKLNSCRQNLVRRKINNTLELHYKIDVDDFCEGGVITITKDHINQLGVEPDELFIRAYDNTMKKYPYELVNISNVLGIEPLEVPMYVLSNNKHTYGAGTVLYKGIKEALSEEVAENVAIIPSSVHEVIVVPDLGNKEQLTEMIQEVNATVVSEEDILSDIPYELVADGVLFEL